MGAVNLLSGSSNCAVGKYSIPNISIVRWDMVDSTQYPIVKWDELIEMYPNTWVFMYDVARGTNNEITAVTLITLSSDEDYTNVYMKMIKSGIKFSTLRTTSDINLLPQLAQEEINE